jgi:FkbM family methyltransferase
MKSVTLLIPNGCFVQQDDLTLSPNISGIIHVGANLGQEREAYGSREVIWIEANPDMFALLQENLKEFPTQRAYQYAALDVDDAEYTFHIDDHWDMAASSIFPFKHHLDVHRDARMVRTIKVSSITIDTLMARHNEDPTRFQKMVVDVQGSDLLAMRGAVNTLKHMSEVQCEVSTTDLYDGGCTERQLQEFLGAQGFKESKRYCFGEFHGELWSEILWARCK